MSWQQLHIQCNKNNIDLTEALLLEQGAISILLEDAGDEPLFEPLPNETPLWSDIVLTAFFDTHTTRDFVGVDFERIASDIASQVGATRFWLTTLEDTDWTKAWAKHYQPIQISDNLWIVPKWLTPPNPQATNILIDPGLAFGTGYHATTRLCLDWLDKQDLTDKIVLDYGCGSGILGIGACLLGAKQVLAVDIDPQALLATNQNAQQNGVEGQLQSFLPDEFADYLDKYQIAPDVIVANILAKPLIALATDFAQILPQNARIVLSGLIQSQVDEVLEAYRPYFKMDKPMHFDHADDSHWYRLSGIRQYSNA